MKRIYYLLLPILSLYNCNNSNDPFIFDCSETIVLGDSNASNLTVDFYPYDSIDSLVFIDSTGESLVFVVEDNLIEREITVEEPCDVFQDSFMTTYRWTSFILEANLRSSEGSFIYSKFVERTNLMTDRSFSPISVSYTHLTLPTTPYV